MEDKRPFATKHPPAASFKLTDLWILARGHVTRSKPIYSCRHNRRRVGSYRVPRCDVSSETTPT
ncbi:hypothetical protein CY34DRAFT_814572 [Suillus luteus UH-Slu-Lm8-n1]|uniref:Uncharacterized protein n=1 Tax=Suillus luteus UH-Slu-Lm8-n1 TaxID=930992 RepID=A0A0D0AHQ5_9AGAM|nr:hypothetical protein CY34DRAFT_814572 [Suillus luteus UH-Slu-Lm8-n1]